MQDSPPAKRPRKSAQSRAQGQPEEAEHTFVAGAADPVSSWIRNKKWPREYFEPDDRAREEILEDDSWLEEMMAQPPIPVVQYVERDGFRLLLPIKKASASLRRKQSDSSLAESSSQKNRETKSTPYRNTRYTTVLETKGSFLRDFDHETAQAIEDTCHQLLDNDQTVPQNSLFCDNLFDRLC